MPSNFISPNKDRIIPLIKNLEDKALITFMISAQINNFY